MGLPNGVHHLAICTRDMKEQIEFFHPGRRYGTGCAVLDARCEEYLSRLCPAGDSSSIAFVQGPESVRFSPKPGSPTRAGLRVW